MITLVLMVAAVYVVVALTRRAPVVFADEAGYLGNARWLSGGARWWMDSATFYRVGYPLLLAPLFMVIDDPELLYRTILLVNVAACALLAGLLYSLARWLGRAGHRGALAAALVGCAYPAVAVHVGIAWVEIVAMAGVAVLVLSVLRVMKRPGYATLLAHASIVLFLVALHGRFTVMIPVALLLLLWLALTRGDLRLPSVFAASYVVIGWLGIGVLERTLLRARWDARADLSPISIGDVIAAWPSTILRTLIGQLWYLAAATGGLAALGYVALVRAFLHSQDENAQMPERLEAGPVPRISGAAAALYVGTLLGSVIAVSTATIAALVQQAAEAGLPVDYAFYGRYNEVLVPTLLALGIATLFASRDGRAPAVLLAGTAVVLAIFGVLCTALRGAVNHVGLIQRLNVLALDPFLGIVGPNRVESAFVVPVTAGAVVVTGMLAVVAVFRPRAIAAVALLVFAAVAIKDVTSLSPTLSANDVTIPIYRELRARSPATVAYDLDHMAVTTYYGLPFWLDSSRFVGFHASSETWPTADLYVGPASWPKGGARGLRLLTVDPVSGEGYWISS